MFEFQDDLHIIKRKRTFQKCYSNRAEINSMHKVTKTPGKVQNTRKYDIGT